MVVTVETINDVKCAAVRIASDLFQTFYVAGSGKLTLSYTLNCDTPAIVDFATVLTTDYVLVTDTTTYYDIVAPIDGDKVCDGIYCASLVYEPVDTSTKIVEFGSNFVSCSIECQIYDECMKDSSSSSTVLYYQVLKDAATCDTCDCTKACLLWGELERLVTGYSNVISLNEFTKISTCVPCSRT